MHPSSPVAIDSLPTQLHGAKDTLYKKGLSGHTPTAAGDAAHKRGEENGLNRVLRVLAPCAIVGVLLVPVAESRPDAGPSAQRWALPAKSTKSPELESRLEAVSATSRDRGATAALQAARARGLDTASAKIRVVVEPSGAEAAAEIVARGGSVEASAGNMIEALVPPAALSALAAAPAVEYVRPPRTFTLLGTESEGVAASDANDWHDAGATGAGAKVAIVDGGFGNLAARQAAGELPAATTVDYCGGMGAPESHGTAVAEIVHEMAPAAALTLICVDTEVDLVNAVAYAAANGISVVNHSVGWYNTARGDGNGAAGTPDAVVAYARANGILWVNAAGNSAQEHWNGTFADGNGDGLHEFAGADNGNSIVLFNNEEVCGFLKWDAWPTTNQDFDLYLGRDSTLTFVAGSANVQDGSQRPTEEFCYTNTTGTTESFSFVIDRYSGASAPRLDLFVTISDALEYRTPAGSLLEPATSPYALAVGAVCWSNSALEPYSALGPTIDGRIKPDLTGPSAVTSAIYGSYTACGNLSGFPGTSSSAPHVAGAAALLQGMFPLATTAELQAWLEDDALDLGAAGKDSSTGSGKLLLPTSTPTVETNAPGVELTGYDSISVAGTVSPNGLTTSYRWEYGTTASFGSQTGSSTLASPRAGQQLGTTLTGLTPDTEYYYRLVATNLFGTTLGTTRTQRTAPALPPTVTTRVPQAIGAHQARLDGLVNPERAATSGWFEWGPTASPYANTTPQQSAGAGGTATGLVAEIAGLDPNTEYHYRFVAQNVHGTTYGQDLTFTTTGSAAPVAVTGNAVPAQAGASVSGQLTPNGLATTYRFDYGVVSTTPVLAQTAGSAGGYAGTATVSATLSSLQPSTLYRYRLVATNSLGMSEGEFKTFETPAAPAPPSGGGGGGGGGGGSIPNLRVKLEAGRTTLAPNESVDVVATLTNAGGAGSLQTRLVLDLPATIALLAPPAYERGSGCTGTQKVDCFLDYLPDNGASTTVRFAVRVSGTGPQSITATASADRDSDPTDNATTLTFTLTAPPSALPPVSRPTPQVRTTGDAKANVLNGTSKNNVLRGLGGNDRLYGRGGNDTLYGGAGNDLLDGGLGLDRLFGGTGNDTIRARDGRRDVVDCGPGRDTAVVDRRDAVRGCETVRRG